MALRQLRVIGPEHHRDMTEERRLPADRLVEQQLPRRVRDVIFAANHMADLHQRIVNDNREVVGRDPVGPDEDEIAYDVRHE